MISYIEYRNRYPNLALFNSEDSDPSLVKSGAYLGGGAYAAKTGLDSGLTRLLGARLERHSTGKKAAQKIMSEGGYLDTNKGVRKSTRLFQMIPEDGLGTKQLAERRLRNSLGSNFVTGYHPNSSRNNNLVQNLIARRTKSLSYRIQGEIDFDKITSQDQALQESGKHFWGAIRGTKGKTLFVPLTDKEVFKDFKPDFDDPIALMTKKKVKVYSNRMSALAGHLKKNGLSQIRANPGRVATGAAILGVTGAIATKLAKKGFAEVKAYKRNGRLVKAYRRKLD